MLSIERTHAIELVSYRLSSNFMSNASKAIMMRITRLKIASRRTMACQRSVAYRQSKCYLSSITSQTYSTNAGQAASSSKGKRIKTNDVLPKEKPTSRRTATLDLMGLQKELEAILDQLSKLKVNRPIASLNENPQDGFDLYVKLFTDTQHLFHALRSAVDEGRIRPSGKHGKELSKFLELVLFVYQHSPQKSEYSVFKDCEDVLHSLKAWNLDVRTEHYESAIAVANRERRWNEAAQLFWRQIEPEAGYNPVQISVANPIGLYAIARSAQEQGSPAAEQVFDAVGRLSMVSPRDQTKCELDPHDNFIRQYIDFSSDLTIYSFRRTFGRDSSGTSGRMENSEGILEDELQCKPTRSGQSKVGLVSSLSFFVL